MRLTGSDCVALSIQFSNVKKELEMGKNESEDQFGCGENTCSARISGIVFALVKLKNIPVAGASPEFFKGRRSATSIMNTQRDGTQPKQKKLYANMTLVYHVHT